MSFECGIVGLPNVGKSTLFNALTSGKAEAANFPFCTIDPNKGIVKVPDKRLNDLAEIMKPESTVPNIMTFVDIAGLVKGASKGQGLGNQFLGHIRETQAIAHVVRCFKDPDVVHVDGSPNSLRDIEVIETELMLADLDTVMKKYTTIQKTARTGNKVAAAQYGVLDRIKTALEAGNPVRSLGLTTDDLKLVQDFHLMTSKKMMYLGNIDEGDIHEPEKNPEFSAVVERAKKEGSSAIAVCGKIEAEIAQLSPEERTEFLKDMGLKEPSLHQVIREGYKLLGLITFFTAGPKEVRAWTIPQGTKAPQAAGAIHTDFERGFIRAEIYHHQDMLKYRSESAIRDAGLMRLEGKEYIVKDGDVIHFRFAV